MYVVFDNISTLVLMEKQKYIFEKMMIVSEMVGLSDDIGSADDQCHLDS